MVRHLADVAFAEDVFTRSDVSYVRHVRAAPMAIFAQHVTYHALLLSTAVVRILSDRSQTVTGPAKVL